MQFSNLFIILLVVSLTPGCLSPKNNKPNIVFILADDMGYGDIRATNLQSKNKTPSIDRISSSGLIFTDMHAAASWCVPSRYGLLTGAYPSRTNLNWQRKPVIKNDELTLPQMLNNNGYKTAMIGKWHLGFETGMNFMADQYPGGPVDRGFDYFYGLPHSLDIEPYLYIENSLAVQKPTQTVKANSPKNPNWNRIQGEFWRQGKAAPEFKHNHVLDVITDRSIDYIKSADRTNPYFLYIPLTAPHTPWLPGEKFVKKTPNELYFAFMAHVDDCIGRIDQALKDSGQADNTIFIVTSDNGPVWYEKDIKRTGHKSSGIMRGMKGDVWEGGHRVPFIVRWPNKIKPGTTSEMASFTDILPTLADIAGDGTHGGNYRDGYSLKNVFAGGKTARTELVMPASRNTLAVRKGNWKLIPFIGSGGFSKPSFVKTAQGETPGQLYNLKKDPSETQNLYDKYPEKVKELEQLLKKYRNDFRN